MISAALGAELYYWLDRNSWCYSCTDLLVNRNTGLYRHLKREAKGERYLALEVARIRRTVHLKMNSSPINECYSVFPFEYVMLQCAALRVIMNAFTALYSKLVLRW